MSKKKDAHPAKVGTPTRTPHQELADEASDWDSRRRTPSGFAEDPSAVPRAQEATAISLRMPSALLELGVQFDVYRPSILERPSSHCSIVMATVGITNTGETCT